MKDKENPNYNKCGKTRWLMEAISRRCEDIWNLHEHFAIDGMMVKYKDKYCPIRQYIHAKPIKWGIEVWCVIDSYNKFVYRFTPYCGASSGMGPKISWKGEPQLANDVVKQLFDMLGGKGHCVILGKKNY